MPRIRPESLESYSGTGYPPPHDAGMGRYSARDLGDAAGLTQFGVVLQTLEPGAASSIRHWHEAEDEFVWLLSGALTVEEDHESYPLAPGEGAGWKAGVPVHHRLVNHTDAPATYLVVGTRAWQDCCHYADIDLVLRRDAGSDSDRFTRRDGTPLPRKERDT
ncbi:cupin domain-containing protein [Oceanicella sp. SM1341]|uniref:cupin domain-containing protein n=1 Tax=Oceanicella sp. SM1341 TaxID=1548889 RepID=UPI000E49A12B|nr:cupin domain-containing protein [Oceanicella sp. SM1341]